MMNSRYLCKKQYNNLMFEPIIFRAPDPEGFTSFGVFVMVM
jgi:hypothetical protein